MAKAERMDAVVIVYVYQTEIAETLLAGRAPVTAIRKLDGGGLS